MGRAQRRRAFRRFGSSSKRNGRPLFRHELRALQSGRVQAGRSAEHPAVLAVELRRAGVADGVPGPATSPGLASSRILAAYPDRGGNSVDTANVYTNGHSEVIIGQYLAGRPGLRDRIVLGTKFFWNLRLGDRPSPGSPATAAPPWTASRPRRRDSSRARACTDSA